MEIFFTSILMAQQATMHYFIILHHFTLT